MADLVVVLDACVLVQAPLRDTLLRLAEHPLLYVPRWSDDIIAETVRTLEGQFGLAPERTAHLGRFPSSSRSCEKPSLGSSTLSVRTSEGSCESSGSERAGCRPDTLGPAPFRAC